MQSWLPATQSRARAALQGHSGCPGKLKGQKIFVGRIFFKNGIIIDNYSKTENQRDVGTRRIKICPLPLIVCSNQQ